jgi:hypothetical protein
MGERLGGYAVTTCLHGFVTRDSGTYARVAR